MEITKFLASVAHWAESQPDIVVVALVGSYARDAGTPTSDIDVMILTSEPERYWQDTRWIERFGKVQRQAIENWGDVTSLRVWYEAGQEVEFGLTTPAWATPPINAGAWRVISEGMKVLFDRENLLNFS